MHSEYLDFTCSSKLVFSSVAHRAQPLIVGCMVAAVIKNKTVLVACFP